MQSCVEKNQWSDFFVSHRAFTLIGINLKNFKGSIIRRPLLGISLVIGIDFVLKSSNDLSETTAVLSPISQMIIGLWKVTIFIYKRESIKKLVHCMSWWNKKAHVDELEVLSKFRNINLRISKFYYTFVFMVRLTGLLMPIIIKTVQYLQGKEYPLEVSHKGSYFWDTTTHWGYVTAFMWCNYMGVFLVNASTAMDTLFLWFVINIVTRYHILNLRFRKVAADNPGVSSRRSFVDNIRFHSDTLNKIEEVKATFGEIIFVQSIISCLQICFLAYRFTSNVEQQSVFRLFYQTSFLVAVAMQLMLYCYCGQMVKDEFFKTAGPLIAFLKTM